MTLLVRALIVLALTASTLAASTGAATARPVKDLQLTLTSSSEPVSGDMVTFTGTGPEALSGAMVKLLRRVGKDGDWVKVAQTRMGGDGTFAVQGVATGVGANKWRVTLKRGDRKHVSNIVATTVFGWYYLAQLNEVDHQGFYEEPITVGGETYNKSLKADDSYGEADMDYIEYNVSYRCKTFEAVIGMDDQSATSATATFAAFLDGAETNFGSKSLGPGTLVTLDTSSRLRLRLEITQPSNGTEDEDAAGYGDARVLCSGKP